MNTSLHHIIAQLRIEEMRHQAARARCARDPEAARTWSPSRHARARTWAARHWHRPTATGASASARPSEVPR
jgi:hypothetical protein